MVGTTTLVVPCTLPAAFALQDDERILRPYRTANGLLNRGLYDLAIPEYQAFLNAQPGHAKEASARYGLSVCYFRLDRWSDALVELQRLDEIGPFEFAAEVDLLTGHAHFAEQNYVAAAGAFSNLVNDHRTHALASDGAAWLVEARYRGGDLEGARDAGQLLSRSWPQAPGRARAEFFWGLSEIGLESWGEASQRFSQVLALDPDGPLVSQSVAMLARSLDRAGQTDEAASWYEDVLEREVDGFVPEALLGLAQIEQDRGNDAEAAEWLDELLDQFPDDDLAGPAHLQRGRIAFDQDQFGDAESHFKAIDSERHQSLADDAAFWIAKSQLRAGEPAAAAMTLDQALETFPDSELRPSMQYDRAVALSRNDETDAAIDAFGIFREANPNHALVPDALFAEVSMRHAGGDYDASLRDAEAFVSTFVSHPLRSEVSFLIAENQFLLEDYEGAEGAYRNWINSFAGGEREVEARFRLGMCLHRQRKFSESRPHLESVASGIDTPELYRVTYLAMGDGYFAEQKWSEAEAALSVYTSFGSDVQAVDDAMLKLGLAQVRQDRHVEALASFDRLLADHEDSPHALQAMFERGQTLLAMDRTGEATDVFEAVLATGGDESRYAPYAMKHLGTIAQNDGQYELAAEWFDRAANSGGAEIAADARFERAYAMLADEKYEEAADAFEDFVETYPDHEKALDASVHRAIGLSRSDQYEDALDAIDAIDLDTLDVDLASTLLYEHAWLLREMGEAEDAALAYRTLLERDPETVRDEVRDHALLDLAGLSMDENALPEAVLLLEELDERLMAREEEDRDETLLEQCTYRRGVCAFRVDDYESVVAHLDGFGDRFPESEVISAAALMCGESLLQLSRLTDAVAQLELVTTSTSVEELGPALLRTGEVQARLQSWDASAEAFERFIAEFPDDQLWFQAQFGIAWARENQQRYDDAIAGYEEIVAVHDGPTAARAQFQIGECLFAQKQHQDAIRELLKVDILYAYPEWSAAALFEAGRCFEAVRDPDEAAVQYTAVVDRFPGTEWATMSSERLRQLRGDGG